jgi:hypothetical protein
MTDRAKTPSAEVSEELDGSCAEDLQLLVPLAYEYGPGPDGLGVVMASWSFEFSLCDGCDNVHLWLKNQDGDYWGTATFTSEQVDQVCEVLQDLKSRLTHRSH